jgi:hypothetical protein
VAQASAPQRQTSSLPREPTLPWVAGSAKVGACRGQPVERTVGLGGVTSAGDRHATNETKRRKMPLAASETAVHLGPPPRNLAAEGGTGNWPETGPPGTWCETIRTRCARAAQTTSDAVAPLHAPRVRDVRDRRCKLSTPRVFEALGPLTSPHCEAHALLQESKTRPA